MKYLIFDAGPIISLTMNGLLPILEGLKKEFNGEFILPPQVKKEVVDNPIKIKRYELEAIKVKNLINKGIFKSSSDIIPPQKLEKETSRILKLANSAIKSTQTGEKITIVHKGEASCLAFSNLCKGDSVIVIDERTTRLLTEAPENLKKLIERKVHLPIKVNLEPLREFKKFKFIRSAELLFIAYKKGVIPLKKDKSLLDALLYSVKFKGTAISSVEIEEMKKLIN